MRNLIVLLLAISAVFYNPTIVASEYLEIGISEELIADLRCMELNLYHEARGESKAAILAVGHVTLNRVLDRRFPNTICEVVYQRFQFSWVHTKKKPETAKVPMRIREIAYKLVVLQTYKDNTKGSLFFHNHSVNPAWGKTPRVVIGGHIFYR
jgi:spore germination cell wall hydrolase CwlJ-like protein